jgi:hypothetical protein
MRITLPTLASLLLAIVLSMTGCKVWHHSAAAVHGGGGGGGMPISGTENQFNLPPAAMMMHPGPGVDGPGPGVLMPEPQTAAVAPASQLAFVGPLGMQVAWDVGGAGQFDSQPLVVPGRYDFPQGAIYRLKISNIPARPGIELYPSIEIAPTMPRTEAYLAHNSIPIQFTEEDFDQVLTGNFVTKVIYLPDPEFQDLAIAGVETLVSTRLDPGVDPIVEADRRGSIMAIIRVGNKDLQAPGAVAGVGGGGEIIPQSYNGPFGGGIGPNGTACPPGYGSAGGAGGRLPGNVAGVTAPEYGMTYTGTPIGLPGPPHLPFGGPAGLCYHSVQNHTHQRIPGPVHHFNVHVKQEPGFRYPQPASSVHINETAYPDPMCPQPNCPPGYGGY